MARTGSITVAALLGTGLASIGFALSGVSALGDDLQAARTLTPAPVLTPGEEEGAGSTTRGTTPAAAEALRLEDVCDRSKREHRSETDADATTPTSPATSTSKAY